MNKNESKRDMQLFGSSDFERRENILTLIKEKMSQYYHQIIIITHEKDVIESIPYFIEMEGGKIINQNLPESSTGDAAQVSPAQNANDDSTASDAENPQVSATDINDAEPGD